MLCILNTLFSVITLAEQWFYSKSNAVLDDLVVVKDGINNKEDVTVLQLAVLLLCHLLALLWEGLSQEDKPLLLQVLTS